MLPNKIMKYTKEEQNTNCKVHIGIINGTEITLIEDVALCENVGSRILWEADFNLESEMSEIQIGTFENPKGGLSFINMYELMAFLSPEIYSSWKIP